MLAELRMRLAQFVGGHDARLVPSKSRSRTETRDSKTDTHGRSL